MHQAHDRAGLAELPDRLDTAAMRKQGMMIGLVQVASVHAAARREIAVAISIADETGDLVDGEPVRDAIAELLDNCIGIAAEGVDGGPCEPAPLLFQGLRQVPVKQRDPGRDAA